LALRGRNFCALLHAKILQIASQPATAANSLSNRSFGFGLQERKQVRVDYVYHSSRMSFIASATSNAFPSVLPSNNSTNEAALPPATAIEVTPRRVCYEYHGTCRASHWRPQATLCRFFEMLDHEMLYFLDTASVKSLNTTFGVLCLTNSRGVLRLGRWR